MVKIEKIEVKNSYNNIINNEKITQNIQNCVRFILIHSLHHETTWYGNDAKK